MNDEIEGQTYKKWYKKFNIQKAKLESEIQELSKEETMGLDKVQRLLPHLTDLPGIFKKANIFQKHSIVREVFKAGFIYVDGVLRTPYLNPVFAHNALILKEKGLLLIEQPSQILVLGTGCSEKGS